MAHRRGHGVFFKVSETKCPSAQKRGAGKDVTAAAYISKFSRPSAQVHGRSEHRRGRGGRGTGRPGACTGALDDQTRSLEDGMTAAGLENATIVECSLV